MRDSFTVIVRANDSFQSDVSHAAGGAAIAGAVTYVLKEEIPMIICAGFSEHVTEEIVKSMGIGFLVKPVVKSDEAEL